MTNKVFLETVYLCSKTNEKWEDDKSLELINSKLDLQSYCKAFKKRIDIICDYRGIIENIKLLLDNREPSKELSDYLYEYIDYVCDLKEVVRNEVKTINWLDELIKERHICMSDNFHNLKIIMIRNRKLWIKGKKYDVSSYYEDFVARLSINNKKTDIGAIFVKDKNFDIVKVKTKQDETEVIKRVVTESDSYNIAILPYDIIVKIRKNLDDVLDFCDNNKKLFDFLILMNKCNINDRDLMWDIYKHLRDSKTCITDFYRVISKEIGLQELTRLFDIVVRVLEKDVKDSGTQEKLKKHIIKILKFRQTMKAYTFIDEMMKIVDFIYSLDDININQLLLLLKDGNINYSDILDEAQETYSLKDNHKSYDDESDWECDYEYELRLLTKDSKIYLYDLDERLHRFSKGDKELLDILKSQRFLFIQDFDKSVFKPGEGWKETV